MGRVMVSGQWQPMAIAQELLARMYKRDSAGKFSSSSGGAGGVDRGMSDEDYDSTYGEPDGESNFGAGGFVRSFEGDNVQVGFTRPDGTTDVFSDMSPSEAGNLRDAVDWASDVDMDARGDRGANAESGLVDWKNAEGTGLKVGPRGDGDIAVAADDGSEGIHLTAVEAVQFSNALDEQISAAGEWG